MNNSNIPSEYTPISAWGYFGYNILFSIPIIGFIFLIIFSFDSSNINRRNYARSFFIIYLLIAIVPYRVDRTKVSIPIGYFLLIIPFLYNLV